MLSLLLLAQLATASLGVPASADPEAEGTVTIVAAGEEPEHFEPGSLVAPSFLVSNPSRSTIRVSWEIVVPQSWTVLNGVSGVLELEAESERWLAIDCILPAGASPGSGEFMVVLRSEDGKTEIARVRRAYLVPAAGPATADPEAEGTVTIVAAGEEPELFEPSSLVAPAFLVSNPSRSTIRVSWEIVVPQSWTVLNGVSGALELEAGSERWLAIYCILPAGASPGSGELMVVLRSEDRKIEIARARHAYLIPAAGRLTFVDAAVGANDFVWGSYSERTWVRNDTNVSVHLELEAESSKGWDVVMEPERLDLAPGAGARVVVEVEPPSLRSSEVRHTVIVTARSADLPSGRDAAITRMTATVLSDEAALGGPILGGRIELEGLGLGGEASGVGVNLSLNGSLDAHRRLDLRFGEPLPFGSSGTVGRRATYLGLGDDRWGGVLVGRTARSFTPLTAYSQWGDWGAVHFDVGPARVEVFSSLSEPDTVVGRIEGVSLSFGDRDVRRRQQGFGMLAFAGDRAPSQPTSEFEMLSLWASRQVGASWVEGEIAVGNLETSGTETAAQASIHGSKGRWQWVGELRAASERFPGAIWNTDEVWGSASYRVWPDLRIWAGGSWRRARDPEVQPAVHSTTHELGATWKALRHLGLSLSRSQRTFDETLSQPGTGAEDLTRLRVDFSLGARFLASVDLDLGERREAGLDESVLRAGYTVRYRPSQKWQLRARFQPSVEEQEIFDSRQRWSLLARWQASGQTWVDLEGQQVECGLLAESGCRSEPATRLSLGRRLVGPLRDWSVVGFVQRQGGGDPTVGVRLGRDLRFRSPFGGSRNPVQGRILVPEGALLPTGATVTLGDEAARVDVDGRFHVRRIAPGRHLLRIDPSALGVGLVSAPSRTVTVSPDARGPTEITLRLEVPGRVAGHVVLETGGERPEPSVRPLSGVGIRLRHDQWPQLDEIAVTGTDGSFVVSGLLPGKWRLELEAPKIEGCVEPVSPHRPHGTLVQVAAGHAVQLEPFRFRRCVVPASLMTVSPLELDGSR